MIDKLNKNEIEAVSGGIIWAFWGGVTIKTALATSKKLSMVYCVGKELKEGLGL